MLDRHGDLAVPDESYFVPQLAHRHGARPDRDAFLDDLRRLPTLREWGLSVAEVAERLPGGATLGRAIGAVFGAYAAARGKRRWGDKTPMYMRHLPLLERLWPDARYVHLVRDGRDAAVSFLAMPEGVVTRTWAHPQSAADFACQWRSEVRAARALGGRVGGSRYHELRYEELVQEPERELRAICAFAHLEYEPAMLGYVGEVDLSAKPHQQRLAQPPTPGVRDWRDDMGRDDARAFEDVAGDLLAELDYELLDPRRARGPAPAGRARLARYRVRAGAYDAAGHAYQRSPLWRRSHPPLA
jgi:Sulfotransferase family